MALRATKGDENPAGASIWRTKGEQKAGFSTECPMGLRPTKSDEDAPGRSSRINNLDRVFNGAVSALAETTALLRSRLGAGRT